MFLVLLLCDSHNENFSVPTARKRQLAIQDLESFNRITNLPIVESGWNYAGNIYNKVKVGIQFDFSLSHFGMCILPEIKQLGLLDVESSGKLCSSRLGSSKPGDDLSAKTDYLCR